MWFFERLFYLAAFAVMCWAFHNNINKEVWGLAMFDVGLGVIFLHRFFQVDPDEEDYEKAD